VTRGVCCVVGVWVSVLRATRTADPRDLERLLTGPDEPGDEEGEGEGVGGVDGALKQGRCTECECLVAMLSCMRCVWLIARRVRVRQQEESARQVQEALARVD
jgi:hypothetical protein